MGSTLAIDIGGTFTDLATFDPASGELRFEKTLTTTLPDEGAIAGLRKLAAAGYRIADADMLKHGTTVVINAILEREGAITALITTEGFRDVLEIGRGGRPESFNVFFRRLPPLIPRDRRFEIRERMSAHGEVLIPLDREALPGIVARLRQHGVEAVAICFLHGYRNADHEREVAAYIRAHTSCFVTSSHELSREFREYERTSTTALNAFVGPRTGTYVARFERGLREAGFGGQFTLMGSAGGVLTAADAVRRPVLLIESGPVGGAAGAAVIGKQLGQPNIIAFDMGGTTAKTVMIEDGEAAVTSVYYAGGYNRGLPVQAAVLDIVEVGTGGGSIASVNEIGGLAVGPRSAGGYPGPACYGNGGNGGTEPTVTDANLVLGRLSADNFLGGEMQLDVAAAEHAIATLAERLGSTTEAVAAGILRLSTLTMASSVRMATIERGYDPRDFAMVAYGGAGPLHAVDVAREMNVPVVIIPPHPGHFSAYGMLHADLRYDLSHAVALPVGMVDFAELARAFAALEREAHALLAGVAIAVKDVRLVRYADMRYQSQEHTIKIRLPLTLDDLDAGALRALFEAAYARRYGHSSPALDVDVVSLRLTADGAPEAPALERPPRSATAGGVANRTRPVYFAGGVVTCAVWQRDDFASAGRVSGPAIIEERASTTVVHPGDRAEVDALGNIIITIGAGLAAD